MITLDVATFNARLQYTPGMIRYFTFFAHASHSSPKVECIILSSLFILGNNPKITIVHREVSAITTGNTPGIFANTPEALNHELREPFKMMIPRHIINIPV
jgi:hypothetical protein